jgi:hypothetical protein
VGGIYVKKNRTSIYVSPFRLSALSSSESESPRRKKKKKMGIRFLLGRRTEEKDPERRSLIRGMKEGDRNKNPRGKTLKRTLR